MSTGGTGYDLLVIGGGLVGAALACALAGRGLRIALVEAQPLAGAGRPADDRSLALAYGTRRIFEGLGLWPALAPAATPILRVHISEHGGFARLDHRDEGVEALGYVIEARELEQALSARLPALSGVELFCPASLEQATVQPDAARVRIRSAGPSLELTAKLLIAADGARSQVRQQLGIGALQWDYGQSAITTIVTPQYPHQNTAYERFTARGALALLPLREGRCAVVCTVDNAHKDALLGLSDQKFLIQLQARFGDRLGRFQQVGRRQAYPLRMVKARGHGRRRVALIGNAAHTLHPIAAQGFNLGMRDVAALAEVIADAQAAGRDLGERSVLERYADWRRWDQRHALALTDGLTRLFGNPWLGPARRLGLLAFDLFPPAKHLLARRTMGLDGRLPRLARGLPLSGTAPAR